MKEVCSGSWLHSRSGGLGPGLGLDTFSMVFNDTSCLGGGPGLGVGFRFGLGVSIVLRSCKHSVTNRGRPRVRCRLRAGCLKTHDGVLHQPALQGASQGREHGQGYITGCKSGPRTRTGLYYRVQVRAKNTARGRAELGPGFGVRVTIRVAFGDMAKSGWG